MNLPQRVDFILVEPVEGGNVGSSARALKNMGFSNLRLVNPQYHSEQDARKMAVHAEDLLRSAKRHASLAAAITEATWVVGLSGRPRTHEERKLPLGPAEFGQRMLSLSSQDRVALVFGPEPSGLTNAHLGLCQDILTWPTSPAYPSMNLAQAVMLTAWEVRRLQEQTVSANHRASASAGELDGLMEHLRHSLTEINYLNPQNPDLILNDLRKVFSRAQLDTRELRMLRGIFHRLDVWVSRHGGPPTPNQTRS